LLVLCVFSRVARFEHHGESNPISQIIPDGEGAQWWERRIQTDLSQSGDGLLDGSQVRSDSRCFPPPESIKVNLPNTLHEQLIVRSWVTAGEVAANTKITLKGGKEVVPCPSKHVSMLVSGLDPVKTFFIYRLGMKK